MFPIKKKMPLALIVALLSMCSVKVDAQDVVADTTMLPIIATIQAGNADSLALFFNQRVELSLPDFSAISSRNQAKMMLYTFFKSNKPTDFSLISQNQSNGGFFIVGTMSCADKWFRVSFLTKDHNSQQLIYQFSIE